jgi:hypothetical protein
MIIREVDSYLKLYLLKNLALIFLVLLQYDILLREWNGLIESASSVDELLLVQGLSQFLHFTKEGSQNFQQLWRQS